EGVFAPAEREHWMGEGNDEGVWLVQTGFGWTDPAGTGTFKLTVWYEFYNSVWQDGPVNLYDSSPGGVHNLGFTPGAGDQVRFEMWYHDSNSWGLQIQDESLPGQPEYSHYVYPAESGA